MGAYGGRREIMDFVAPVGPVYQAGTLSGNPLAMTAGLATIRQLLQPGVFMSTSRRTKTLVAGLLQLADEAGIPLQAAGAGTMFGLYFLRRQGDRITDYDSARQNADTERYARFFHAMLEAGFYFAPSQFEAAFLSTVHTDEDIQRTLAAAGQVFRRL